MVVFRIKQIRESKKITQYSLSKKTRIARSFISELENNKRSNVSLEILGKIANVLDVDIKELFYSEIDIKKLKKELYERINIYGLSSKEVLEISQVLDLFINIEMNKELDD